MFKNLDIKCSAVGRFGNVLFSLGNAIHIAKNTNSKVTLYQKSNKDKEKMSLFSDLVFDFSEKESELSEPPLNPKDFFTIKKLHKTFGANSTPSLADFSEICMNNILPILNLVDVPDPKEDVVIHMRSGDLFDTKKFPRAKRQEDFHVQPPLSFFEKVIRDNDFKTIRIITESDFKNPTIEGLKKIFPQTVVQSSSMEEDFCTLLKAKNFILSHSTFAFMAALLSVNLKKAFMASYSFAVPTRGDPLFPLSIPKTLPFEFIFYRCDGYEKHREHYKTSYMNEIFLKFPLEKVHLLTNNQDVIKDCKKFQHEGGSLQRRGILPPPGFPGGFKWENMEHTR